MQTKRYHIIIDLHNVSNKILNNSQSLNNFLSELPSKIDMHVLKGPVVARGIPENPGLSGFVIIDYSHISVHTFTKNEEALVDIFSCKPFEQENAIKAVTEYFQVPRNQARVRKVFWG